MLIRIQNSSSGVVHNLLRQNVQCPSTGYQADCSSEKTSQPFGGLQIQAQLNHWKVKHLPLTSDRQVKRKTKCQRYQRTHNSNTTTAGTEEREGVENGSYICPQCSTPVVPLQVSGSSTSKQLCEKMKKVSSRNENSAKCKLNYQVMTDSGISIGREAVPGINVRKKKHVNLKKSLALTESFNDFRLSTDPPPSPAKRPKEMRLSLDSIYNFLQNEEVQLDVDEQLPWHSRLSMLSKPTASCDENRIGKIRLRIQDSIKELENMPKIPSVEHENVQLAEPTRIEEIYFQLSVLSNAKEVLNRQMEELRKMYLQLIVNENDPEIIVYGHKNSQKIQNGITTIKL